MLPITLERGWSRQTFGLAIAIQNLSWGIAQPFTGMIADRCGSARVMLAGLLIYAAGLFLMTQAITTSGLLWSAGICVGIGLSGTSFGVVYGALSRLVRPEQRGWALGLAGAIGGFAQFAMVPTTQLLLEALGWVNSLLLWALLMLLLLPFALPMRDRAGAAALSSVADLPLSAALREAFRHPGFWLLNMGFLACGFQLAFVATHLPAYLLDKGMRPANAVAALAIIALCNVLGTYCCGLLGANYSKKRLLASIYLLRSAAMALFVLLPLSPLSLYLFAALMGFIWLGTVPLTTGLIAQIFGLRYLSTLFGFVFFGHQLGAFVGVWMGGVIFAATRSYDLIWLAAMALGAVAAALHWPIDEREPKQARAGVAPV